MITNQVSQQPLLKEENQTGYTQFVEAPKGSYEEEF